MIKVIDCFIRRAVLTATMLILAFTSMNAATLTQGSYVYFDAHGGTPDWSDAGAVFSIEWYVNGNKVDNDRHFMTPGEGTMWSIQVPYANVDKIRFLRLNPNYTNDNPWNQTEVIDVTADNLCYYATTWTNYPGEDQVGTKTGPTPDIIPGTLTKGTYVYFDAHVEGYPDLSASSAKFQVEWFVNNVSQGRTNMSVTSGTTWAAQVPYDNVNQIKFWRKDNFDSTYDWNSTETKNVDGDNKTYFVPVWTQDWDIPIYIKGQPIPTGTEYWLIVKDQNGNNTKSFKMSDSRYRVYGAQEGTPAGQMTKRYYTVMVKSEWINAGNNNQMYIATDKAGEHKFAGTYDSNNYSLRFPDSHYGVTGYMAETYNNTNASGGNFLLNNTGYTSYVVMIDTKSTGHTMRFVGNGVANAAYPDDNYYLIGNFANAVGEIQINPTQEEYRRLMTKYYYKNGNSYQNEVADADSIVYRLDVQRPTTGNGFDNLYIMFAPKSVVDKWNTSVDTDWGRILRPEVDDKDVDATAMEGGLVNINDHKGATNNMCINPLLTETQKLRYNSYTVYLNITKSTYRIEFHDAYYIAGPAVRDYNQYSNRRELVAETNAVTGLKSWNYTGNFVQGQKFLVFATPEKNGFYFHEDDNKVADNKTYASVDDVVAPENTVDFAFYNHIQYDEDATRTEADGANAMYFPLPNGEYTIRFYNLAETTDGNAYYTIDKVCKLNNASTTYKDADNHDVSENRGGWLTYSDDVATYIPTGVSAYYAAGCSNGKVQLKQLGRVIPAHCGVLLHDPMLTSGSRTYNLIPVVENDKDSRLVNHRSTTLADVEGAGAQNYFVDSYQHFDGSGNPTAAKVSVDATTEKNGQTYYNYFFNNKITARIDGVTHTNYPVPLNFWKAKGSASRKKTYLQTPESMEPAWYENGTYYIGDGIAPLSAAKSFCMVLDLGLDVEPEMSVVTSITEHSSSDTQTFYNLQGMKVSAPAVKGLYIVNGKKMLMK